MSPPDPNGLAQQHVHVSKRSTRKKYKQTSDSGQRNFRQKHNTTFMPLEMHGGGMPINIYVLLMICKGAILLLYTKRASTSREEHGSGLSTRLCTCVRAHVGNVRRVRCTMCCFYAQAILPYYYHPAESNAMVHIYPPFSSLAFLAVPAFT